MYEVIGMSWERSNLILTLNKNIEKNIYLVSKNEKIKLDVSDKIIKINITNLPTNQSIEEGKWYLETDNEKIKINSEILNRLDDNSRIFKYGENLYALLISFDVDDELILYINSNYMMKNTKYKKKFRLAVNKTLKSKTKTAIKIISLSLINLIYKINYFFNNKRNLVLFLSENDDKIGTNFLELHNLVSKNYKTITYAYNFEKNKKRIIPRIKELFACSKSKYIIIDNYVGFLSGIKLPKKQVVAQIWHAGVGFKSVGYARFGKEGSPHPFVSVHRKYTYAFVDDIKFVDVYKEVFGISEDKIISSGMPRLNKYLDESTINNKVAELYKKEPILKDKKIILFSPTYRGSNSNNAYYDYSKINLDIINKYCIENDFIFVIKMHPFITEKVNLSNYSSIIDLSNYNINDLIYISDIMITDYSSCAYEYSLFNRPLIFYRFDKELYEYSRSIHTIDVFTDKQYEIRDFNELMNTLDSLKNVDINKRFDYMKKYNNDSLSTIYKTIFGGVA